MANSRIPEIMADAAHVILTADAKQTTENFFMDDEVLISNGETIDSLAKYLPNNSIQLGALMQDFIC
jgi:citronellol/citronellal dehydrogenase